MFELAILGGGPAGAAAAVYAARKKLKSVLITESFGGQSVLSSDIQNWIGTPTMSGDEWAKQLEEHVRTYAGDSLDVKEGEKITAVEKIGEGFKITTTKGELEAKAVLITTGANRRKLSIPGAEEFENKGVVYCASCDGPLFSGMDVAVIGGGNAGFETAAQLLAYAKSVTLLHRRDEFKADKVTVDKVLSHPNMKALTDTEPVEIKGDKFVSSLSYKNCKTGEEGELPVGGVFVEIGIVPNTSIVSGIVELTKYGQIVIDPKTGRTSSEGVWAAGDVTDSLYHQNNIAAGDAVRALEDIYLYLRA